MLNCAWSGKGSSLTIYIVNLTENKASCFFFLHLLGPSDPLKGDKVYFNLFSCPEALILSFSLLQTSPSQIPLNPTFKLFPTCGTFLSMSEGPTITYAGKGLPAQKKTHSPKKLGMRQQNAMIQNHVPEVCCSGNQSLKVVS